MAIKGQAPIVPVAITGARNAMRKGSPIIYPVEVRVRFGEPVETSVPSRPRTPDRRSGAGWRRCCKEVAPAARARRGVAARERLGWGPKRIDKRDRTAGAKHLRAWSPTRSATPAPEFVYI